MTEITCIGCPLGCRLSVDVENDYAVSGNSCKRGEAYGKNELKNPTRVLTTTVKASGGIHSRCPVRTEEPIPKGMLFEAMELLQKVELTAPVKCGDVVVENILNTGVNVIATRDL